MSSSTTQTAFDITASTYDSDRAKLIPCYDAFYRRATDLIAHDARNILDLGAGTGLLSQFVRQWYPNAHIVLADLSEPMLAKARVRLANDNNVTFEVTDYTTAPINGTYDSIVSALSIHHIDDDAKRALFAKIFKALRPGGTFVNAEQVAGPTPCFDRYNREWHEASARAAGTDDAEWAASMERMQHDQPSDVESQLRWLREAGFDAADCVFKDHRFAVLAARRATGNVTTT